MEIQTKIGKVIINGGNPLPGCPSNWDGAHDIEAKLNEGKVEMDPKWSFDCGFKLDFDGSLVSISSRFYPPKEHYGTTWDGAVTIYLLNEVIAKKEFDCQTLDELEKAVNDYIQTIKEKLKGIQF